MERRLAAILVADMAGYSRLMEQDEEGVLERQKTHRRELIDPEIVGHGGRIVKTTGDGMLAEFASAQDAVRCAIGIQTAMAEREAASPMACRITYRVGINLGDVVFEEGDVFGDGVNVASRLQGLSEPGGVCVSDVVHQAVADRFPQPFRDMGGQHADRGPPTGSSADGVTPTGSTPTGSTPTHRRGHTPTGSRRGQALHCHICIWRVHVGRQAWRFPRLRCGNARPDPVRIRPDSVPMTPFA